MPYTFYNSELANTPDWYKRGEIAKMSIVIWKKLSFLTHVPGGEGHPQQEARDLHQLPAQGKAHAGTQGDQGRLKDNTVIV